MESKRRIDKFLFFLLAALPLTIILGPAVSLLNTILICISFITFFFPEKIKLKYNHPVLILLFFLYLYLLFNSIISQNYEIGIARNVGFIRFLILFIFINYFLSFLDKENIFLVWGIFILLVICDIFFEFIMGYNLLGWGGLEQPHGQRIVSFFKDEPIAGGYISGFSLMIFGYYLNKYNHKNFIPWIFLLASFLAVLFTGERSNLIKISLGILFMFMFFDFLKLKIKLLSLTLLIFVFIITIYNSSYLKNRYLSQFIAHFSSKEKIENFINNNLYSKIYKSGFNVFKNYPIFGVGNKNYRVETCFDNEKVKKFSYQCQTHPHQIYLEFLSEHGLVGSLILISIFFILIFKILKISILSKNYIQIGALAYILFTFTPLIPSGSFFNDFNLTLFWINFSVMYGCSRKSNIFRYNKYII